MGMEELSQAQKARNAIATFKTLADALILRGSYKPSGTTGGKLEEALRQISPEIYGSMNDSRIVELNGLEYVVDRLPRGIEKCNRIVLTAQEELNGTTFDEVNAYKRRRTSFVVSEKELCFVITRGSTEIYDILTHLTFLNIEAQKIYEQSCLREGSTSQEWKELEQTVLAGKSIEGADLDKALWNLSNILGRTYRETRETYFSMENKRDKEFNNGLFKIIYALGKRIIDEEHTTTEKLTINFTPSLQEILGHHKYASAWAVAIKHKLVDMHLQDRPTHIVSANLHSFRNLLYGKGALLMNELTPSGSSYDMVNQIREEGVNVDIFAKSYGFTLHHDNTGSNLDVQIIETEKLGVDCVQQEVAIDWEYIKEEKPIILVMDYAFGAQAYEVLDELLCPCMVGEQLIKLNIESISIMGKAGILTGKKGDIMLASAFVMEGTPHSYILENDFCEQDFNGEIAVYSGPMVTVLGTSLQNRAVLERFHSSSWSAIGLEMEGGHYQRAINAAIIRGHIPRDMKIRYAYYASDNPLVSGETLASGPMGAEGIAPTYLISKIIIEKILSNHK